MQTQTCLLKKFGNINLNENFTNNRSCLSVHLMDTVRAWEYAILPSAYF